jgi:hypothetical protein
VLEQHHEDGKWHVVSYASRTCSKAESRLGPTDGELLAIVYALEKFHHHVAGTSFTVITDHDALVHLNHAKSRNPKLARWAMKLADYDMVIQHRAGRIHNNADGLSRSRQTPCQDTPPDDQVAIETTHCPFPDCPFALEAALLAFDASPGLDGDPAALFSELSSVDPPTLDAPLGPR